ncbi:MAG: hypothetical protein QM692_11330, partial [Thermomicrobiales bacterium]
LRLLAASAAAVALGRGRQQAPAQSWTRTSGESCWQDGQCVAADAPLICADNGTDGGLYCCTVEGGRCGSPDGCCGLNTCIAGFCQSLAGPSGSGGGDVAPGGRCQTTAQCNRDQTGAICEFTSSTGDSRCCWYEGSFCTSGAQCCGDRICSNGVCQFPGGNTAPSGNGGSVVVPGTGPGAICDWEGCPCVLWRDPSCRASCPLNDPCGWGFVCNARSVDDVGTCVRA